MQINMEIEMENVGKTIRGTVIIKDISLHWSSGNIYWLQGYNGCGKTMLMRLVSGLIRPTSGKIFVDEKILGKELDFPPSAGILLENPAFLSSYTGFKNLSIIAGITGNIGKEDIKTTLNRVGLDPDDKRKYRKYSLGMKQRLGVAAAIMEKPELIILDEPTNSLDESGVQMVIKILKEEKARGALIVMACHEAERLRDVSDAIYTIEAGAITKVITH